MSEELEKLIGEELSIIELSNKLIDLGYEDICEFGNWRDIIYTGDVVVATNGDYDVKIKIDFKVINCAEGRRERIEDSIVEITGVEDFYC